MEHYYNQLGAALSDILYDGNRIIDIRPPKTTDDDLAELMAALQEEGYEGREERIAAMLADLSEMEIYYDQPTQNGA